MLFSVIIEKLICIGYNLPKKVMDLDQCDKIAFLCSVILNFLITYHLNESMHGRRLSPMPEGMSLDLVD